MDNEDTVVSNDKLFDCTTARLDREVDTSRARMTRTLYVNGFLFSALALIAKLEETHLLSFVLLLVCPIAGAIICHSSIKALQASQDQRDKIKEFWDKQDIKSFYPPFYADKGTSAIPRRSTHVVIEVLRALWGVVLVAGICQIVYVLL